MPELNQRTVTELDEAERASIWRYNEPIWPAHYCWHPEHGWLYWTQAKPYWRPSAVGHDTINTHSISSGTRSDPCNFTEMARFTGSQVFVFAPDGHAIEAPVSMLAPAVV